MINDQLTYRTHWTIRCFAGDAAFRAGVLTAVVDANGVELPDRSTATCCSTRASNCCSTCVIGASGSAYNNAYRYRRQRHQHGPPKAQHKPASRRRPTNCTRPWRHLPNRASQTVTWRCLRFGRANYAWNEFYRRHRLVVRMPLPIFQPPGQRTGHQASGQMWTVGNISRSAKEPAWSKQTNAAPPTWPNHFQGQGRGGPTTTTASIASTTSLPARRSAATPALTPGTSVEITPDAGRHAILSLRYGRRRARRHSDRHLRRVTTPSGHRYVHAGAQLCKQLRNE